MLSKVVFNRFAALVALAAIWFLHSSAAHAAGCSNTSLTGSYGFQATGPQDNYVPPFFFETVGRMKFDGAGKGVSLGTFTRSDGNVYSDDNHPFHYTVAPDCTFTLAWDDDPETFSGIIVENTMMLYFIETSGTCCGSAIIRRGEATRQLAPIAGCSDGSLRGTYGFGSTVTQNNDVPPLFLELAGSFKFDGKGNATTSFYFARNDGAVGTGSANLTYQVSRDCTFTLLQDNGETFAGVIAASAERLYFIETSGACCGSAIIRRGSARKVSLTD
jgi:hypothetical protein